MTNSPKEIKNMWRIQRHNLCEILCNIYHWKQIMTFNNVNYITDGEYIHTNDMLFENFKRVLLV